MPDYWVLTSWSASTFRCYREVSDVHHRLGSGHGTYLVGLESVDLVRWELSTTKDQRRIV